ncbi:uncharacterized protein LOC114828322 [Galendromus occidentalis]|uniref:Uncharacterized protein LOC114828322 n=1 Tax=Galendromus occidentalis TaxID=34638 RepID=A0AAJ7WI06_9ACAR|nr:uncharacterized protein LOC114828322 [Galendromus occidentalis]
MKLFLLTVTLLPLLRSSRAAVEREGDRKPDFDELRLEEQVGDDVELDPYSHESLVRIARQMGVVVTTSPTVHTAKALPKPRLEPRDWEIASQTTTRESKHPVSKVSERLELDPGKLNFAAVPSEAAATTTTPVIDKRIGELLPEDYSYEGKKYLERLRIWTRCGAESGNFATNVAPKKGAQSGKPNRKTHVGQKGNDKHQHKTKLAATHPTTSIPLITTSTTSTTTAPSTSAQESNSSPSVVAGSSSIDKHQNFELAALNLYHRKRQQQQQQEHLPLEVDADEDIGRLPLTGGETSSEQHTEIARHLIKGISGSKDSIVLTTAPPISISEEGTTHQKRLKPPKRKPESESQQKKSTSHEDKWNSVLSKRAKKPSYPVDEDNEDDFDGASESIVRPVSQLVHHRETKRKPPKKMTTSNSSKSSSPSKLSSSHKAPATSTAASSPTTTSTTTTTTTAKPSAETVSDSLEDFDLDLQQSNDGSSQSTTEVPMTPAPFLETSTARSQKRKTSPKKSSNSRQVLKSGSVTKEPPQLSKNTSFVASASYQRPQIVLPPPPPPLNPLAALGNLIPLLQLLNHRPAPAFYSVPPTKTVVVNEDTAKKPPVKAQQPPQKQYQVPYYQVPAHFHLVNTAPFYGYQNLPIRGNNTLMSSTALSSTSPSKPKEKLSAQQVKVPSDSQKSKTQKKKKKPPVPAAQQNQNILAQTPNISNTIRSMMHFLNSNNLLQAAQPPKRPRTPKALDPDSADLTEPVVGGAALSDGRPEPELIDDAFSGSTGFNRSFTDFNSTDDAISDEGYLIVTPIPPTEVPVAIDEVSSSPIHPDIAAKDSDEVSAVLTVEKPSDRRPSYDFSAEDRADNQNERERDGRIGRRMDFEPIGFDLDPNSVGDDEALGRALVGGGANYKMLLGLLTGAFGKRRDARSNVRSDAGAELEKKRQIANNLIMQSILYNPPPMYNHRLPNAVWPVLNGSPTFAKPIPAHRIPPRPPRPSGRPAFYGKQFVVRPREPRYFVIDGSREDIPRGVFVDEQGRSIRDEDEFMDEVFPSIPLDRGLGEDDVDASSASSPELRTPMPPTPSLVGPAGNRISKLDSMPTPTNESASPATLVPTVSPVLSVPKRSTESSSIAPELGSTLPSSSSTPSTSTRSAYRIVIPLPSSTSTVPPPVIRFSNRIGDRTVRRSTEPPATGPAEWGTGRDGDPEPELTADSPRSFFRLAGEVRKNSSDSLILRRISTSPKQAFLHRNDPGPLQQRFAVLEKAFLWNQSSPSAPESRRQKRNRRSLDRFPDPDDDNNNSLDNGNGSDNAHPGDDNVSADAHSSVWNVSSPSTFSDGRIAHCFAQNATFSQKLNCNDQQFSCDISSEEDLVDNLYGNEVNKDDDVDEVVRCSCEDECVHYGDCCWDKISQLQKDYGSLSAIEYSRDRLTWLHCVRTESGLAYFMVAQCPSPVDKDDDDDEHSRPTSPLDELCSASDSTAATDPLLRVAVTSRKSLVTYKNIFCARCHDDADDVQFWRVELQCPRDDRTERADRALDCPFVTMPPKSLFPYGNGLRMRRQFARRCNPYVDYADSTKLDCKVISANESSTIEAPNADVANKLSIMCDLIYLPTLDLNASGCDKLFYRNRFCALCERRLPGDLSCPLDAEILNVPDRSIVPDQHEADRFPLIVPSTGDDNPCEGDNQIYDPWKSMCRSIHVPRYSESRCSEATAYASNLPAAFNSLESKFPFIHISLAFLLATLLLSSLIPDRRRELSVRALSSCRYTYVGEITVCLVSAILGGQFLSYVSLSSRGCPDGILCFLIGFGFHFCTTASFAWSNVLLSEVRYRLQHTSVLSGKTPKTFVGYLLYTLLFSSVSAGCTLLVLLWQSSTFSIRGCSGCGSLCFLLSSSSTGWYAFLPAVSYAVVANFCIFLSILRLWRSQSEVTVLRSVASLEFRNVVFAVLLANLVAPTILLGLVANKLENQRIWLGFLLCYACHGPFVFLLGGTSARIFEFMRRCSIRSKETYRAQSCQYH